MKTQTLVRISGMILLATVVSLILLAPILALQYPQLAALASVSWNGSAGF